MSGTGAAAQAGWAVASALAFAAMSAAIKLGYAWYGLFELVFWRNALGAAVLGAWALATSRRLSTPLWPLHLRRSAAGTSSMVLWFAALAALPLPTAATLGNTSPLFTAIAIALAARRAGLPPDRRRRLLYAAAACGFAGVALALRPTLDGATLAGFAAGLGSGLLATFVYFEMRSLGAAGEPSWRVVFWFSTVSSAIGLAGTLGTGGFAPWRPEGVVWLAAVAGFALVGQICMTRAFAGPATLLAATLQYTNIGFAALIGAWAFDDALSARETLGLAAIAASGVWATWIAARAAPTAVAPARGTRGA
ncbi:MAG TPA: DMT family transporter [Burkholderiaceae bacterium]|nr:DMT family transporter [Burkholderiaceae bacterium]